MKKKPTFSIPQIEDPKPKKENNSFVSPFFGAGNKDEIVIPKDPLKGNIHDRYQDYSSEKKETSKDQLKKEFGVLDADEIRSMISKTPAEDKTKDQYVKVKEKKINQVPEKELAVPFGLNKEPERDLEPSDEELNQVLGDYEGSIFTDEMDPLYDEEPTQDQLQESLSEWFDINLDEELPGDRPETADYTDKPTNKPAPKEVKKEVQSDSTVQKKTRAEEMDEFFKSISNQEPVQLEESDDVTKSDEPEVLEQPVTKPNETFIKQVEKTQVEAVEPKKVTPKKTIQYIKPPLTLLNKSDNQMDLEDDSIKEQEEIINHTLEQFRVGGKVVGHTHGPTVTRFEVHLDGGVMTNKIVNIANNLKMNLAAIDIRIEAPIPGKTTVGIEVPNRVRRTVYFGDLLDRTFIEESKPLEVVIGVNLGGDSVKVNIEKMPHGLIAGATGSGKSVCIDTILVSLLMKSHPDDLKLLLIDPKRVGLATYSNVPHLASPIVYDSQVAAEMLKWLVEEMERRYNLMHSVQARDIDSYNDKVRDRLDEGFQLVPKIVLVIEEMADLMAQAASDVEMSIHRLAQKSRAAGIHMIIATQRPSTDIIKGSMKANIPTRFALKVSSYTDSMTIIDYGGAEALLGNGDMLMSFEGQPLQRLQGAFVSPKEIDSITDYLSDYPQDFIFETESLELRAEKSGKLAEYDDLFLTVAEFVIETQYASINKIQKQFNIGYNRASDLFTQLTEEGIVSSPESTTPRKVLMTMMEFHARYHQG